MLASIPSPSRGVLHLGPIPLRAYAACILLGVLAAIWLARRRWSARGFDPREISDLAVWAVPAGLIGARIYHVITDYQRYTDHPANAFKIWDGGLGIWGGVALGAAAGLYIAKRWGMDLRALLDVCAPAIPLAQAIGRFGNYFNQELFGRPTKLPWGLEIDLAHRPTGYENFTTFHPTFLYESLWCLLVVALVIAVERKGWLKAGYLFAFYVAAYTFGRFWFEWLRIDPAHKFLGLRINDWVSVLVFAGAAVVVRVGWRGGGEDVDSGSEQLEDSGSEQLEPAVEEPLE